MACQVVMVASLFWNLVVKLSCLCGMIFWVVFEPKESQCGIDVYVAISCVPYPFD